MPPQAPATAQAGPRVTARVAVYDVIKDGKTVLSTSSPSAARDESRRLGGSIKVTSRPVAAGDPVPA